jgi:hypothetical protein
MKSYELFRLSAERRPVSADFFELTDLLKNTGSFKKGNTMLNNSLAFLSLADEILANVPGPAVPLILRAKGNDPGRTVFTASSAKGEADDPSYPFAKRPRPIQSAYPERRPGYG